MAQAQTAQLSDIERALIFTWYSNFDISYAEVADAFTQQTGKYIDRLQAEKAHEELCKTFDKSPDAPPEWAMHYRHKVKIPHAKAANLEADLEGARSILIEAIRGIYEHHLHRMKEELSSADSEHSDIVIMSSARSQQYAGRLGVLEKRIQDRKFSTMQSIVKLNNTGGEWPQQRHWLKRS